MKHAVRCPALLAIQLAACTTEPSSDRRDRDCGVDGGQDFRVRVHGGLVFPYKPEGEQPWDWDGDVPDWMIDLTGALGDLLFSPELATASEILEIVDEVAPIVLDGTTPPDPQLYALAVLDEATVVPTSTWFGSTTWTYTYGTYTFGTLDTSDDTIEPRFDLTAAVTLFEGETLWLDMFDEDVLDDDYVGSVGLGLRDLRDLARCGITTLRGPEGGGLYSLDVEVEPR